MTAAGAPAPPGRRWGPRRRGSTAVVLAATVALGLLSRRVAPPGLLAEYTGDALYATAAYFAFALAGPAQGVRRLGLLALGFAAAVEFAQLLSWPWLQALRATPAGALVLGQGFQVADLFAHVAGVLLACAADVTFLVRSILPTTRPDRLPHQSTGPSA